MGSIVFKRAALMKVIQETENAAVIYRHLPQPEPGSDEAPNGTLTERVARATAAIAVLAEEARYDGNTTAVATAFGTSRFRLIRLRQWLLSPETSGFHRAGPDWATKDEGYTWVIAVDGDKIIVSFSVLSLGSEATDKSRIVVQNDGKLFEEGDPEEEEDETSIHDFVMPDRYIYIQNEDVYAYYSSKLKKYVRLPGAMVRDMRTEYSNHGGGSTINTLARKYGIPRAYVMEMKTLMGWTKDQSIYTPEEIVEDDPEAEEFRATEALERKRMVRFEQRELRSLEARARKWDNFELGVLQPFIDVVKDAQLVEVDVERLKPQGPAIISGKLAAVVTPFDLHYGKNEWAFAEGEAGYSMSEFRDLVLEKTEQMVQRLSIHKFEKIFLPFGHDFYHVTNDGHYTTNGTPQDMRAPFINMIFGGSHLLVEMIERYRRLAPVEVIWVPGNHDRESSLSAMMFAAGTYSNTPDVRVHTSKLNYRTYVHWEKVLMGHVHGDGLREGDLPRLMATEMRERWGQTRHGMWFVGHYHFEKMKDLNGTQIFQAASLAGSDRWHFRKGYVGARRALDAYILHETDGKVGQDTIPVEQRDNMALLIEA